jgi:hypothetical protein
MGQSGATKPHKPMSFIHQLPNRFDAFLVPVVQVLVVHGCLTRLTGQELNSPMNGMERVYDLFNPVNGIIVS